MIHHDILQEIKKKQQDGSFIYPDYGRYSISEIPPTVLSFFGIPTSRATLSFDCLKNRDKKIENLLFFFIDGFAYDHYVEYEKSLPFFRTLGEAAHIYPLTSVFPSTTSAALTCLQTGFTPQEHGLVEWTLFLEELDRISYGTLKELEIDPKMLYDGPTLYETLREHGVTPYVFTYEAYMPSPYSLAIQKGAEVVTFKNLTDLFPKLLQTLEKATGPHYFFVYWGDVDSTEHIFGPKSTEHVEELKKVAQALETEFKEKLTPAVAAKTLMLVSSDHGQANIQNEDIIYLNSYLDLENSYLQTVSKKVIVPTGAPHDVFLHIDNSKVPYILDYLRKELKGKAEVITTAEARTRGLFGLNTPSARFLKRIGDILILPYEGYHIWYQHTPDYYWHQLGIHGGLSRQEMLVPFVVIDLGRLTILNK